MYSRGVRSEPRRDAYKEACMGPGVWAGSHVVADQEGYHLLEDSCHSQACPLSAWLSAAEQQRSRTLPQGQMV